MNPFSKSIQTGELVPLSDGGAYLASSSSVFYVSGERATPVSGLPEKLILPEVHALADGHAILQMQFSSTPSLFLLRGATATPISEGEQRGAADLHSDLQLGFLFATNQRLRTALNACTQQQNESQPDLGR